MTSPIFSIIQQEQQRQEETINLIASENYTSHEVMQASGSVLTNKYAEGYPGRRYYGGCEFVDLIESYAIEQGKKLFGCDHMNVQPHSGSSANFAAYFSLLKPGATILGMQLNAGGHLTHGYPLNFSGKIFNAISYGLHPETEELDYDQIAQLADQHKPEMIIAGASAYARLINYEKIAAIAKEHNSIFLVDMAHIAGLVAGKQIPSPVPYADIITSTTHKTLRGPRGGIICSTHNYEKAIDRAIIPGTQGGPLMHIIAAKAIAFEEALQPDFMNYQKQVIANAKTMVSSFQTLGYRIVSGGTDTHLFLVDLSKSDTQGITLTGKNVEEVLGTCNIVLNRNTIPGEKLSPSITSGIRIGTPAITTRGFKEKDAQELVSLIHDIIKHKDDETFLNKTKQHVISWCKKFPIHSRI